MTFFGFYLIVFIIVRSSLVVRETQLIQRTSPGLIETSDTVCFNILQTCNHPNILISYIPTDFDNSEPDEFLDVKFICLYVGVWHDIYCYI